MIKATSRLLMILVAMATGLSAYAQGNIPILTWRSHFSYRSIIDIAQSTGRIYAASPNGLFYIDKQELSIQKLTKNDGLNDVSIGAIGYAQEENVLLIGYENGNIDLVEETNITNLRSFRDASLIGDKRFHDITVNDGLAYLSSDQGVLVIDLDQRQIVESYQNLGVGGEKLAVFGTAFFGDSIYAATSSGLLSASMASEVNRQDFNNWKRSLTQNSFPGIESDGTQLVAFSNNSIYRFSNNQWPVSNSLPEVIVDLKIAPNGLNVLTGSVLYQVSDNSISTLLNLDESQSTASSLLLDGANIWLGDGLNGLRRFVNDAPESFSPTGPASDFNWAFSTASGDVLLVHGGHNDELSTLGRPGELSRFSIENGWTSQTLSLGLNNDIFDLVDLVTPAVENGPLYLASFDRGLVSFTENELTVINESATNSTLESVSGSINMTAINADDNGLWMTNYGASSSLHFWNTSTDEWTGYNLATSRGDFPIDLFVAPNGDKWLPIDHERGGGIVVFNESENRERYLSTNGGQGGLPGSHVTSLALDDDFFLWVGTNEGIAFYPNLNAVLNGTALTASVPIFEGRLLLRDEFITDVVIDPGNRKWFGTRNNGIWLFSETGEELIYHFTADNSPLPSDNIKNLFIQPQTGELFIGTDKGTVSFRSDATQGTDTHQEVEIYPNPAMRKSVNEIVINGLVNNAQVKITDASGKLVREIRAQGATALWNARDYNGRLVSAGVYLVFSSNADGTETFVGKIAVI